MRSHICQHCCNRFTLGIFERSRKRRFCSETCRKRAERQRARARNSPTAFEGDDHDE